MHVAIGTIKPRRHFQHTHRSRRLEVTGLPRLYSRITGVAHHHWQPADFKLCACRHDQISIARPGDQRRFGFDAMRVLHAARCNEYVDMLAANLFRQCAPLGHRGEDFQISLRREGKQSKQYKYDSFHRCLYHVVLRSELVRAMRTEAEYVLQENLIVSRAKARVVVRPLQTEAGEFARAVIQHRGIPCRVMRGEQGEIRRA